MNNPNQHGPIDWSDFLKQAMGGSPHTEKGTGFGGSGFDGGNADFSHLKKRFAEMGKRSLIRFGNSCYLDCCFLLLVVPSSHQYS